MDETKFHIILVFGKFSRYISDRKLISILININMNCYNLISAKNYHLKLYLNIKN